MKELIKKVGVFFVYGIIIIVFCFALLISLARLVNPVAQNLSVELISTLEETLSVPVKFGEFEISWELSNPVIWFDQVVIGDKNNNLKVKRLITKVDLWSSVLNQDIKFEQLIFQGALLKVKLEKQADKGNIQSSPNLVIQSTSSSFETMPSEHWLTKIPKLQLINSTIELLHQDELSIFEGIQLDLVNDDKNHKLKIDVLLPKQIGKKVQIIIDANGDDNDTKKWDGGIYVEAEYLSLAWLAKEFPELPVSTLQGRSNFKLWTTWQKGKLIKVHSKVMLQDFSIQIRDNPKLTLDKFESEFWLSNINDVWQLKSNNFNIQDKKKKWNTGTVFIEVSKQKEVNGFIENLNLKLTKEIKQSINQTIYYLPINSGYLRKTNFIIDLKKPSETIEFSTDLVNIDISAQAENYGVKNYSGKISSKNQIAYIYNNAKNMQFDSNGIFRKVLDIEILKGLIKVDFEDNIKAVSQSLFIKTQDAVGNLRLDILKKSDEEPIVDIGLVLSDANVKNISNYFPVSIMTNNLVSWLDSSLNSGQVPKMYMLLKGNMTDFPFENKKGIFDIGFNTENLKLKYQKGWPALNKIAADVRFYSNSMSIVSNSAILENLKFEKIDASIEDLYNPFLNINTIGSGDFNEYKTFVAHSPLNNTLGIFTRHFDFSGDAGIKLKMGFDIDKGTNPNIKGKIGFKNVNIKNIKTGFKLSNLQGDISFTENDLLATNIKLKIKNEPWILKAYTRKNNGGEAVSNRIYLRGEMDTNTLVKYFTKDENTPLSGKSKWKVNINIPIIKENQTPLVMVNLSSNLKGTSSNYPHPFDKKKNIEWPTNIELKLPNSENLAFLKLQIKDLLFVDHIWSTQKSWNTVTSDIVIGKNKSVSATKTGIKRLYVDIEGINAKHWLDLVANNDGSNSIKFHDIFNQATIKIKNSIYNNRNIKGFRLDYSKQPDSHFYKVDSDFAKGVLKFPIDSKSPNKISLDYLKFDYLKGIVSKKKNTLKINDIPSLDIKVSKLSGEHVLFNNFALNIDKKNDSTVKINNLSFINPHFSFKSNGRWWGEESNEQTNLIFDIKVDDLGKALLKFNFKDTFEKGEGSFQGDLQWPGSLIDANLTGLNGNFKMSLEKGSLKKIEPGIGRIFGLFSLQTLPNRLLLDFDDVTGQGFPYNSIKGDFKIANGNSYTHNLSMNSSIGLVKVNGRTGLVEKDYDQIMSYTPSIVSNLPVVSALTVSPQAGLTVAIVEAILKTIGADISKAGTLKYHLTGSWDKPDMSLIPSPEIKNIDDF